MIKRLLKKNKVIEALAKAIYLKIIRIKFDLTCNLEDFKYLIKNFNRIRKNKSELVFVCSYSFFYEKKWQVASQASLWHQFVDTNKPAMCFGKLGYLLFYRKRKVVVALEPHYSAPTINYSKNHNKVIIMVSDSHSKQWLNQYIAKANVTDVFTPYRKTLLDLGYASNILENNIHSFPWCISEESLIDCIESSKNNEVLGFGATGSDVYDLREWSFNTGLLETFNYAGSQNYKFKREDYFNWLRSYSACVVAMSTKDIFNYTVAKYFEIPSQGILMFAFPTVDLEDFGFEDGVNCIFVNKENFKNEINKYKESPGLYTEIRRNGLKLIKDRHLISHRLTQLNEIISR